MGAKQVLMEKSNDVATTWWPHSQAFLPPVFDHFCSYQYVKTGVGKAWE